MLLCCLGVGPHLMNDIGAVIPTKLKDVGIQLDISTSKDSIRNQNCKESSPSAAQVFVIDPRHVAPLFRKDCVPSSLPHVEISTLQDAVVKKQDVVRDANGKVVVIDELISVESCLPKLIGIDFNSCRSIAGKQACTCM